MAGPKPFTCTGATNARLLALASGYSPVLTVHDPVAHLGARPSTYAER